MTFELRPPLLEAHGLQAAVRDLADEAAREGGFHVDLHTTVDRYPFAIEDLVYRTVQEALSNVRKHARASKVAIALHERQGNLTGWVRDDGRGFDLERALDRRRMRHARRSRRDARAGAPRGRAARHPLREGGGHERRVRHPAARAKVVARVVA